MTTNVQVDVIILSWNRVDDTLAAIRSAHAQIGVSRRILIVDQGSEPENLERLEREIAGLEDVELKKLGRNVGVAAGRNIATAMGDAPCIVALDSDAEFADDYTLMRAVANLQARQQLCAGGFHILNYFTRRNDHTSWDYPAGLHPDENFPTTRFIGAGHIIRRSVFEKVGGYDERLFFCGEELDLSYRMLNTGHQIEYMPDVTILHKVSPEHRVFWGKGRFYYTVRNNLYSTYKFGASPTRLGLAAAAFMVKGLRNGIGSEAVRALRDAAQMCRTFRDSQEDKRYYQLSDETWNYIRACEPSRQEGVARKVLRQLTSLPHQS